MKKLLFYVLIMSMITFVACNDDETSEPQNQPEANLPVAINELSYQAAEWVEITNQGSQDADISDYWLCLGPNTYRRISDLDILAGSSTIPAGGFVVVGGYTLPDDQGGLGLYANNSDFADPSTLVDFVQYGAAESAREDIAVAAGIWTDGTFVPGVRLPTYSLAFDGEGNEVSDWTEAVSPTPGQDNNVEVPTTTFNITITNRINYLGAVFYNEPQNLSDARSNPERASLDSPGEFFEIEFVASPGANMSFVSMSSISNDWLFSPEGEGIQIFDESGQPMLREITSEIRLWDAGTEEENPATFGGSGADLREDDDDNTIRILENDVSAYLTAELTNYEATTRTFTLRITNLRGEFAEQDPIRISPGIVVLHAQDDPFFTSGMPDRGVGLQLIAERGNIMEQWSWLNEVGTDEAPLRLSSSWSTISPGIVYAFNTDSDPWFTQGEPMVTNSGVEELAEDGNNQVAFDYLSGLGIPVVQSEQTRNLNPGEALTFSIEVPTGRGFKLGIGTMLVRTNDWYMSFNNNGVALFDESGNPFSGISESDEIYLFDGGTEEDELVGIGDFLGSIEGPVDDNNIIRRVMSIDDQQYGKGVIQSAPGTAWSGDPRGGYNLLEVDIQPQ